MKAILWDGNKQLLGELIIKKTKIRFQLKDFSNTNLDFDLAFTEIKTVALQGIYHTPELSIKITARQGRSNVFIVDQPIKLKKRLSKRMKYNNN